MPLVPQAADTGFDPRSDVFNRLLKNRVIMLGTDVNDDIANSLCAQLLYLEGEDPNADIWLYINSPGGSVYAGMAIYDTMQFVSCDVATVCMGMAASMGQFLLTAGAAGKRFDDAVPSVTPVSLPGGGIAEILLPNGRIVIPDYQWRRRSWRELNTNE